MAGMPEKLFSKLDERLETTKIKVKLKSRCTPGPKKVEQEKKRGPLIVKHLDSLPVSQNDGEERRVKPPNLPIVPRSCRTPSPPRNLVRVSAGGHLGKQHNTPSGHRLPSPPRISTINSNQTLIKSSPSISDLSNLKDGISPQHCRSRPASPTNAAGRRTPSPMGVLDPVTMEKVAERVKKVQRARLYLLRQMGPHSFLVVSDSTEHKYKVIIGPQTCTCGKGPHCIHLLFVMLRVLQVKDTDSRLYCKQLKNYEVEELVHQYKNRKKNHVQGKSSTSTPTSCSMQYDVNKNRYDAESELCPICLLEMVEGESLVTCEHGCHNKLHHHCISIWAEECLRQNETILCPLCRAAWPVSISGQHKLNETITSKRYDTSETENGHPPIQKFNQQIFPFSPTFHNFLSGIGPLISDIPLPRAENLSATHTQKAQTWIQVFGTELVNCFFSHNWTIRETALKKLAREVASILALSRENPDPGGCSLYKERVQCHKTVVKVCCHILSSMILDPVYKVYIACLRCLRTLLVYSPCKEEHELKILQDLVRPIIRKIFLRCGDGNRRTCQLSVAILIEIVRGQAGVLAVGTHTRYPSHCGLGGMEYVLSFILEEWDESSSGSSIPSWQWLLGRLCVIERLIEEFPQEFYVLYVHLYPATNCNEYDLENCGYKLLNYDRVMSLLQFTTKALEHGHPTINKMAQKLFIVASRLSVHMPAIFNQIYELVYSMNFNLQSTLIRRLNNVARDLINSSIYHHHHVKDHKISPSSSPPRRGSATGLHPFHTMVSQSLQERTLVTEKLVIETDSQSIISPSDCKIFTPKIHHSLSESLSRRKNIGFETNKSAFTLCHSLQDGETKISNPSYHSRPSYLPLNTSDSELSCQSSHFKIDQNHSVTHQNKNINQKNTNISRLNSVIISSVHAISNDHENLHINCKKIASSQRISKNEVFSIYNKSKNENQALSVFGNSLGPENLYKSLPSTKFAAPVSFSSEIKSKLSPLSLFIKSGCMKEMAKVEGPLINKTNKAVIEEPMTLKLILDKAKIKDLPTIPGLYDKKDDVEIILQNEKRNNKQLDSYVEGMHWMKGQILGTGAFSSCYQARDIKTGTLMAVKQVSFCRNSEEEQEKVMEAISEEIVMMVKLDHPNVLRMLGATQQGGHYNVFVEWMAGGSVATLLDKYGPFSEAVIIRYTYQVLDGLAYLHDNQILHRDLKGANLLVDSTGHHLRIADFGAAARLANQDTVVGEFQGQLLGTIAFMAPEVLRGENYGRSCDVWSVGCVMIEMATTKPPWNAHDVSNHLALIFKIACSKNHPPIPEHLSAMTRSVALKCLEIDSDLRPPAKELLLHPCFTHLLSYKL